MKTIPDEFIDAVWSRIAQSPQHTFLILTKRPQRMLEAISRIVPKYGILSNVWLGCTVVNQQEADEKIPIFLQVPGKKFLSIEPMLASVDIEEYLTPLCSETCSYGEDHRNKTCDCRHEILNAVILGGETGASARPVHPDWGISIVNQCKVAGVPVFVKQINVNGKVSKDMSEWPEELRVRELPWIPETHNYSSTH